jgi:hypothetical protein
MARRSNAQLNIRSEAARRRVDDIVRETGKSVTQVVEEAVLAYRPEPTADRPPALQGFDWNGKFFVMKATGGPPITVEDVDRWIEDDRNRDLFAD